MALIPIFEIWNIVTVSYNSVDKEKIKLIMICVHTQLFTNNDRLLRNSPSWRQFKIRSADCRMVPCPNVPVYADRSHISIPVHYFFCLLKNRVKSLQVELKLTLFHSLNKYSIYLFIDLTYLLRRKH